MRKLLVFLMIFALVFPSLAQAQTISLVGEEELELVVKEVPKDLTERLGKNYILVDFEYFQEIEQQAARSEVLEKYVIQIKNDLEVHKIYIEDLEAVITHDRLALSAMEEHIDKQRKIIEDLQPTRWDKYKFGIGILLGAGMTGVAAYGASQLD